MREPDTNVMRATYATAATYRQSPDPGRATEFDRWLAGVKADALREAAATDDPDHYTEVALGGGDYVRDWLNARADRIEADR